MTLSSNIGYDLLGNYLGWLWTVAS